MRTHKHISSNLQRYIVARALMAFRKFDKNYVQAKGHSQYIYVSQSEMGNHLCTIDARTWKLKKVEYRTSKGIKYIHL